MSAEFVVATFYRFVELDELASRRSKLVEICDNAGVRGTILLADEGINATIAGPPDGVEAVLAHLRADPALQGLPARIAGHDELPFKRLKVKIKDEIVTFRQPEVDPTEVVGRYVHPREWNELVEDPEVVVIDTRNDFEVRYGTFEGSLNPKTEKFSDLPEFVEDHLDPNKHTKIAMFCTGGIRCEKATSYMKAQGFEEVYHLKGGILHYLEEIPAARSRWRGECFVFDERETVGHDD